MGMVGLIRVGAVTNLAAAQDQAVKLPGAARQRMPRADRRGQAGILSFSGAGNDRNLSLDFEMARSPPGTFVSADYQNGGLMVCIDLVRLRHFE
jgi:hypothetical protein